MSRIRRIQVQHFRCIQRLDWFPNPGINCIIGPGDIGKSSVLDAIDVCLGSRRTIQFDDSDFFGLNPDTPIEISITVGDLDDSLKSLDTHGFYLRGFKAKTCEVLPEPEVGAETVLTVTMTVGADLEPSWCLYSERAAAENLSRHLTWSDRLRFAPTRVGAFADQNLSWRRGSLLNRVSEDRADAKKALADFARKARHAFGETAKEQVADTLAIVKKVGHDLGIPMGEVTALLDPQTVSLSGGAVSLHDDQGVPLRGLGLGSTRLLIAGLQRAASGKSSVLLIDEIEHGLEPHRLMRLIDSLGAKETPSVVQGFLTTHSPIALRELSSDQLFVLRRADGRHEVTNVGSLESMQATVRACPEAFLSPSVIVCEGASEVGLVRGLDEYRVKSGMMSMSARGVSLADGHGETTFRRANALATLGYRVLVLRDDDKKPEALEFEKFLALGGRVVDWGAGHAIEESLFLSVGDNAVAKLIEMALRKVGESSVNDSLRWASGNQVDLTLCNQALSPIARTALGKAAKKAGWFKTISDMQSVARDVIGPDALGEVDPQFRVVLQRLFAWVFDEPE